MPRYECDRCVACCAGILVVETDLLALLREPRLPESDPYWAGKPLAEVSAGLEAGRCVILACGRPCSFLGLDQRCAIYPTRPNDCVGLQAGDEQCQYARAASGLPPLTPL